MKHSRRIFSALLCAVLLLGLLPAASRAAKLPFSDVKEKDWYHESVQYVYDHGLMSGVGEGKFAPGNLMTRAMIVTVLYRMEGEPAVKVKSAFKDVAAGSWYEKPVVWASQNGIVYGYSETKFGPADNITREQMAAFFYRYAGFKSIDVSQRANLKSYQDASKVHDWAKDSMSWANAVGLIQGMSKTTLEPAGNATRAQGATILMRFDRLAASGAPTTKPTAPPTAKPTAAPTVKPTAAPTAKPTAAPTTKPTPAKVYTVRFDPRTDGDEIPDQKVTDGSRVEEPDVYKRGYLLDGWYTDSACTKSFDMESPIHSDLTLYAHWSPDGYVDVTKYTYEVTPILAPFCDYVYVKTDNPDPTSFCLSDKDSIYWSQDGYYGGVPQCIWTIYNWEDEIDTFADVVYENPETHRVKGGYIFGAPECDPDGGELVVQQRIPDNVHMYIDYESCFVDTDLTITCPRVKQYTDVLIDAYTDPSKSLFENLDAVQNALDELAVYPLGVRDSDKPNKDRPYPLLACSGYQELWLNSWYSEMFADGKLLLRSVYPYLLDSLGFPGTMASVAEKLAPDCEVDRGSYHWNVDITYNGETRNYGGAGEGNAEGVIYTKRATKDFKFDGSANDFFRNGKLETYRVKLLQYGKYATKDLSEYSDLIEGETFRNTIAATGGTWILVGQEGWNFDTDRAFAYMIPTASGGCTELSDAWVDGRYVSNWEQNEIGAKFSDHPNADVVVSKMHYTDSHGAEHTQDVLFSYNEEDDNWTAEDAWDGPYGEALPAEFILTRAQVEAMHVDRNTDLNPAECLIYDGTVYPGTPSNSISHEIKGANDPVVQVYYENGAKLFHLEALDGSGKRIYEGVEWSINRTDNATFYRAGYVRFDPEASGTYVLTAKPMAGAKNVTGTTTVTIEPANIH